MVLLRALLGLLCLLLAFCAPAKPDKAFIFSGQSNATNIGKEPVIEHPNKFVLMFDNGNWVPAKNPMPGEMMNRVYSGVSAWPALGDEYEKLTQRRVFLSGYANSGQNISHWDNHSIGWLELISAIKRGCMAHTTFVWFQGESDSTPERKTNYAKSLNDFLQRIRSQCNFENIVIVSLGDVDPVYAYNLDWDFAYIRNIQETAVAQVIIVRALGLPLQDNVHLTSQALIALGHKIAHAVYLADQNSN